MVLKGDVDDDDRDHGAHFLHVEGFWFFTMVSGICRSFCVLIEHLWNFNI